MAKNNNINVSIFCALKVSEISKVPVLLMANPGTGKSSTVEMFADVRGYKLILLRGNSESAETILGYDVAPTDTTKSSSTKHLRPEWFEKIKEADARGEKCLLFLDEITTATEYVQASLLHLIFERKVGTEDIPESTLIVSAGNYASNLSNSMIMLPPLMNRFMIYNIVPEPDDLDKFLNKYDGAIGGKRSNYKKEIMQVMETLDKQEVSFDAETMDKAGEYIERAIRMTAKQLMTGSKKVIDLKVTDLQNIYSDLENDAKLPGFVTLRTLNYLRDVTVASFKCFGKAGIQSDNYRNMVTGLVGLGVSRDARGEVKNTDTTNDFYLAMQSVATEIEKMNNTKLPEYEKFFKSYIVGKKNYEVSDITAITNKLKELRNDPELKSLDRPLDVKIAENILKTAERSCMNVVDSVTFVKSKMITQQITVEELNKIAGYVSYVVEFMEEADSILNNKRGYKEDMTDIVADVRGRIGKMVFKVKSFKKLVVMEDSGLANAVIDVKSLV